MNKFKLLCVLIACIALLSGCGVESVQTSDTALPSEESVQPDDTVLPEEDNTTEITVEVRDAWGIFPIAAMKYKEKTGVKVNIVSNLKTGQNDELNDNIERIQAELMAGKGADIYANTNIDYIEIGKNNHLCNLADLIAADPDFSDDEYYMNLLTSGYERGDVYSVPLFMMFNALATPVDVPELNGKSLNWEEFFDLAKDVKRSGPLCEFYDFSIFILRFQERFESFIDEENKTHSLNSPEFIKLMEQCKEWGAQNLCIPLSAENASELTKNAFFKYCTGELELLTNIQISDPMMPGSYFFDIPSDSGKNDRGNKIAMVYSVCINAASPNKEAAWEFIKFMLSEDIQATTMHLTPVNRKAAAKTMKERLSTIMDYYGLDIDPDQAIKESDAILNAVVEVPDDMFFSSDIEHVVNKLASRYFRDEVSAEEAAKSIADAIELYFKEQ